LPTTNAIKPIKGSKDGDFRLAYITRNRRMPLAVGPQGPMTSYRKPEIYPSYKVTHKKTQVQNFSIFLVETTRRSSCLEG